MILYLWRTAVRHNVMHFCLLENALLVIIFFCLAEKCFQVYCSWQVADSSYSFHKIRETIPSKFLAFPTLLILVPSSDLHEWRYWKLANSFAQSLPWLLKELESPASCKCSTISFVHRYGYRGMKRNRPITREGRNRNILENVLNYSISLSN